MTKKQKNFCDEYLLDLNATQAAIRAGYSPKTAYSIGNELLKKPEIKAWIDARMDEKQSDLIAKQDEVLRFLTSVMRGETVSETLAFAGQGMQEIVEIHPESKDRLRAAELLGKRYGLYTDKVDVKGNVGVVIVDDVPEND